MVKDKTKDGAVHGMVESEVRMGWGGGNGMHRVVDSDIVGCPLYLGYCYGESCAYEWDGGFR